MSVELSSVANDELADVSPKIKILVLCTGNSARSIMAEALFNTVGAAYFQAWSAGSHPTGRVNPYALEKIAELGYCQEDVSSQSWLMYASPNAPEFDIVMTVCGNAAAEDCPVFSGSWKHIHWGLPDPALHMASPELAKASFDVCFETLKNKIALLVSDIQEQPEEQDFVKQKTQVCQFMQKLALVFDETQF